MGLLELSVIALWIAFVLLLLVNLALARQIGVLCERIAPAGALAINRKLQAGAPAPGMAVRTIDGDTIHVGTQANHHMAQLLFFISPDCPVCSFLIPALKSAARAERGWLQIVLVSDGPEQDHAAYIGSHGLEQFPYVVSEAIGRAYGVAKLPYAVLIGRHGTVAAMGIVNSREHLDSLFEANKHNVASIQEYMQAQDTHKRSQGAAISRQMENNT